MVCTVTFISNLFFKAEETKFFPNTSPVVQSDKMKVHKLTLIYHMLYFLHGYVHVHIISLSCIQFLINHTKLFQGSTHVIKLLFLIVTHIHHNLIFNCINLLVTISHCNCLYYRIVFPIHFQSQSLGTPQKKALLRKNFLILIANILYRH